MKKHLIATATAVLFSGILFAQKTIAVPQVVKTALAKKYPKAKHVNWEKEKGNYEANWGGKSGEHNSVLFSASGQFIEIAKAISVKQLPASSLDYIKSHYKGSAINEAALVTDFKGEVTYEAEINHRELVFDEHGSFINTEKE